MVLRLLLIGIVSTLMSKAIIKDFSFKKTKVAIIGLGYVGLPLAVEFGKFCDVIGFDINKNRITNLRNGKDKTNEVEKNELLKAKKLKFTGILREIAACNVFIVTVPTPIDANKRPDLTPLVKASEMVGSVLKHGDLVIYESTVYPGCTEEDCVPVLEKASGLALNTDFYVGYSPERINPGDKSHRLPNIKKVTSGSTPEAANFVDSLYKSIITAGTHKASCIKVAEAAKVIENTQRDVNIALINELAILFNKLDIDTQQVLEAAGTKWNFLPFRPGLVGGHCIGVDPYYLTHKAQSVGHHPEMILAGRRLNDNMGVHIVSQLVKAMLKKSIQIHGSRILVMGFTFKENCPDIRNTRVIDLVKELKEYNTEVDVYDPWVSTDEAQIEYNIDLLKKLPVNSISRVEVENSYGPYDAVVFAVAHDDFKKMDLKTLHSLGKENHVLYDIKNLFSAKDSDLRL